MKPVARLRSLRRLPGLRSLRRLRWLAPSRLSLRARLLVLSLVLVTTGLAVSDTVVLGAVRMQLVQRADQQLQRLAEPMSRHAAWGSGRPYGQGPAAKRGGQYLPSQYVVQYLGANGNVQAVLRQPISDSDPSPELDDLTPTQLMAKQGAGFTVPDEHGEGTWRVLVLPVARGTGGSDFVEPSYLLAAVSLDDVDSTVGKLRASFLAIGAAVLLLIAALGFFAVRAGLRPLARIGQDAELIAAGRLSHRMPELAPRTEVGRLSATLNGMLTQIEAAFAARAESEARMRRFVADASHELRTPLASIRGFAELHRMGALPDVVSAMHRIESEAVRMGGLVEDLLTLARLDEERPLDLAPMDLRTLAADALHDLTALDPGRPVALTGPDGTGAPQPAPVLGDEARLRQVVTNLVGNAVKHTPPGTAVRIGVGLAATDGGCLLEVADSGPGLAPDQAAQVFERFYRVDASRSRHEGGGAGLGLAIASALVNAHGGTLTLETSPGRGAAFQVRIPKARPSIG
ncbi:HAMP domain-containing sensor histidine kinase [Kitasatospora sp. MAP5-34]|uniref:sensor histidine kinase n=1 Tax=Kitasatospora sp. MAP5-34 TaxID=3035102 RepID=UPI002475CF78|nr:HAMP domain-containing sensor histidine kinase [Kitasatospora sp. MAP5-34]MDH6576484.1 two-component system OmpR family sensor kinase [Kitasatospora sp. MAP5-34]